MIQIVLFYILLANIALTFGNDNNNRDKQLDRISRYTLIDIDTSLFSSEGIIELDAYEQHYKIQLESNEDVHPGKLHHIKGNHAEINGHQQFYTNKNQSCHYHGKVINDKTSTKNWVALALCDNRGIRGMIVAFDDTLYIKPAKTYLDLSHDKNGHGHNLNDQHLAYLSSDEDYSGLPLDNHVRVSDEEKQFEDSINNNGKMPWSVSNNNNGRRRMANNQRNTVEVIAVMDPAWRQTCEEKYTKATWYDNCINDLADLYNGISAEYRDQNWGSNANGPIGTIVVAFAQVYVMFEFTGDDSVLYPDFTYSNCRDMMNTDCSIDGSGYLGKLRTWVGNMISKGSNGGFESSNFDDVQLWSSMNFLDAGGWGYIGTVCRGSLATANIAALYGFAWSVRSAAHELGHNFDMVHDQDTGGVCNKDSGLMGYGKTNSGFSTCSVKALQAYFAERTGLSCLGSSNFGWDINSLPGTGDVRSNYGDNNNGQTPASQVTPAPTAKPTNRPTPAPTRRPTARPTAVNTPPIPSPTRPPTPRPTQRPTTKRPTTGSSSGTSDDWQCVVTVFPVLDTSTFSTNVIKGNTLQGRWTSDGEVNGKVSYELNGYYLYKKSSYWLIATEKDSWSVVAYCTAELLSDCDQSWSFYQNGWVADGECTHRESECGTGGGSGGDTDTVVDPKQCPYTACLTMAGLGSWDDAFSFYDCDSNNVGVYKANNKDAYLCFNTQYSLWFLSSTSTCSSEFKTIIAYCKWTNADITQCGKDAWRIQENNSFNLYSEALIYDCNAAFNAVGTTECTDSSLNEKICVTGNSEINSLVTASEREDNGLEFSLFDGQCAYGKPIYSWVTSESILNTDGIEAFEETTYYLHYNLYKKYNDDAEFSGQWVISDGEINSNYDAICEQESLLDCNQTQWQILNIEDEEGGGMIQFIDDIEMTIANADCDGNTNFAVEPATADDNAVIIVIVCILIVIALGVCGYCLWRRSNKGDDEMIKRHVSDQTGTTNNGAKATPETDELPDSGSPIPETEVSVERKDGAQEIVVTTTYE